MSAEASPARPGAQPWVPPRLSLRSLTEAVRRCRGCGLYRETTQGVMGAGRMSADLMLIGEQPGDREDQEGLPFVGPVSTWRRAAPALVRDLKVAAEALL